MIILPSIFVDEQGSLLILVVDKVVRNLRNLDKSENSLNYPESKYDNLRKGFPGE